MKEEDKAPSSFSSPSSFWGRYYYCKVSILVFLAVVCCWNAYRESITSEEAMIISVVAKLEAEPNQTATTTITTTITSTAGEGEGEEPPLMKLGQEKENDKNNSEKETLPLPATTTKKMETIIPLENDVYNYKEGSFHTTNSFKFKGKKLLDAFVSPQLKGKLNTPMDSGVFVVMVGSRLVPKGKLGAFCRFFLNSDDNNDINSNSNSITMPIMGLDGDTYRCQVPRPILEQIPIKNATTTRTTIINKNVTATNKDKDVLTLSLQSTDGTENVTVLAALWPWRNQRMKYNVAVNNMSKNVECGGNKNKKKEHYCFRDWVLWHYNMGVQHFFIYDNLSDKDHPWLQAAQFFIDQGILTLIDWPYFLGGTDNNKAQRVSMNHAMFAVKKRVKWLGYFDVDEFLVPTSLMISSGGGNNINDDGATNETHPLFQEQVVDLLDATANGVSIDGVLVPMRNAQNPRKCDEAERAFTATTTTTTTNNSSTTALIDHPYGTSRLSRCTAFHQKYFPHDRAAHPKVMIRSGPGRIQSPHKVPGKSLVANNFYFLHFSTKYGCDNADQEGCEEINSLSLSPEVHQLEQQLTLLEQLKQ